MPIGDMNCAEQALYLKNPYLRRIPTAQKPRELEIIMPKRMNPDMAIYEPPYAGIWVEVKGHLRDAMWFPCLRAFPDWLKPRYRVVLVNKSAAERKKYRATLEDIGIHVADFDIPPFWCEDALTLYLNNKDTKFDTELHSDSAKVCFAKTSTVWEVPKQ